MKEITQLGLTAVEQVIRNNVWLLYNELDEKTIDSVSAISMSWEEKNGEKQLQFAAKIDGQWKTSQVIAECDENEDYDNYGIAISLVGGVFGKR